MFAFRQISFARNSEQSYYPIWRIDFEMDSKPNWFEMQAQTTTCVEHAIRRKLTELGVPHRTF
jgi:hypothetical protein